MIGLTVNDILKFIDNADLRKLAMRLKYVLQIEDTWNATKYFVLFGNQKAKPKLMKKLEKGDTLLDAYSSDLVSKGKDLGED